MSKQLRVYREGAKTEFDYQILWEEDFTKLTDAVKKLELSCGKICIVADDTVGNLYGKEVQKALEELDVTVDLYTFPAGEASKNLDTVKELYAFLIEHHYTRKDVLAALGGGVTGDLTGYAAATYLRGIDFIQIPTTLLAQVDSSVGLNLPPKMREAMGYAAKAVSDHTHKELHPDEIFELFKYESEYAENSSGRSVCQWHGRSVEIRSDS